MGGRLLLHGRREVAARVRALDLTPLALFYLVPLLVLTLAAFRGSGLHWALAFYPFFPALLGGLDLRALRTVFYAHGGLFIVQVAAVLVLLALPASLLKDHPRYAYVVAFTRGEEVCRALEPYRDDYVFVASTGYTTSAVMSRFCGVHFPVLLGSSVYGRLDDTATDFRLLDGRDLLVFGLRPINEQDFRPYFREIEPRTLLVGGGTFHVLLGRGFSFEAYREGFLTKAKGEILPHPRGAALRRMPVPRALFSRGALRAVRPGTGCGPACQTAPVSYTSPRQTPFNSKEVSR
jgi:hypothetical protein